MKCRLKSKAEKAYFQRMIVTMGVYLVLVFATTILVRRIGISGWLLYVVAVIPCLPIVRMLQVVALYLKEEKDEFQRQLVVYALLAATSVTLLLSTLSDFLRSYTPIGLLPPFTIFVVFWMVFGATQGLLTYRNRAVDDDQ